MNQEQLTNASYELSVEKLAQYYEALELFEKTKGIQKSDVEKIKTTLKEISKIKQDGKVYAFHKFDEAICNGFCGDPHGVDLYQRQGTQIRLIELRDTYESLTSVDECVKYLKENGYDTIYTGNIIKEFLGVKQSEELITYEDEKITFKSHLSALNDNDKRCFKHFDIEVVTLDKLL